MTTTVTTGTVKIGRWTYPAVRSEISGVVTRNTKRDGTGESVEVTGNVTFTPDADYAASLSETGAAVLSVIGYGATHDRWLVDFFDDGIVAGSGNWLSHATGQISEVLGRSRATVARAIYGLETDGMVNISTEVDPVAHDRWFTLTTLGAQVALSLADTPIPVVERAERTGSGHGSKPGAQIRRPGKSTWRVGDPCPQRIHTLTDELIYVMPSGRMQCKGCRRGYPSNN